MMRAVRYGVAALVLGLLGACGRSADDLTMIMPRSPVDQQIAIELARLLDAEAAVSVTLVANPNPEESGLAALEAGVGDIALVANSEPFRDGIETVIPLYPTVLHIAYRYRDGIDPANLGELLRGSTIFAGPPGSPSQKMLMQAVARDGLSPDDLSFVDSFEKNPDVVVVFAPVLADLMDTVQNYRLFSLAEPQEIGQGSVVDGASLLNPHLRPFVIPVRTYGNVPTEPIVTIAVDKLLVTRADVPNPVIYDLIREVLRLKPALSASNPGLFHQLSADFDVSGTRFVIHPGALAFVAKDEPTMYERYSGVAEVVATLFFGLVSGLFAAIKIYNIRRKNRIDRYYKAAMDIRNAAQGSTDLTVRRQAVADMRALQNDAFSLLVDEKLAADESFRIFITLSNDIIGDLSNPGVLEQAGDSRRVTTASEQRAHKNDGAIVADPE